METPVNRAYDVNDNRRHALALRSRTFCGLARNQVRTTTLSFDADDFFACPVCASAVEAADGDGQAIRSWVAGRVIG